MTATLCVIAAKSCSTISPLDAGSKKLLDSQVLIIGLGGLGTPVALYLAGAGAGWYWQMTTMCIWHPQRQILFTTEDIDRPKSQVSQQRLTQLNPDIQN